VAQSLKSGERRLLVPGGSDARYVPTGHLVYALGDVLYARPFDVDSLEFTGGAVSIVEGVMKKQGVFTGRQRMEGVRVNTLLRYRIEH